MTILLLILKFKLWKFIEKDKLVIGWLVRTIFLKYKIPIFKFDLKFQLRKLLNESLICESIIFKK